MIKSQSLGIYLGLITALIHISAGFGLRDSIFHYYNLSVFPIIRLVYDYSLGYLPFPSIYILYILILYFLFLFGKKIYLSFNDDKIKFLKRPMIKSILNAFGVIVFLFYFLWAFNYYRPSIDDQLGFYNVNVDSIVVEREISEVTTTLNFMRMKLSSDTLPINEDLNWDKLENEIRDIQKNVLESWGDHPSGRVRIRKLAPKGILLRISTAGVYFPFVCEGHIDAGLHHIQWPFTLAHEMAHGHGYTDEGVCNFIGLITCLKSKDLFVRYSGLLNYWKYLYFDIKNRNTEKASFFYNQLIKGIKCDLEDISLNENKYPDIFPYLRDIIYDTFLKSHGVTTGLSSYNEIIIQVQKWKNSPFVFNFYEDLK